MLIRRSLVAGLALALRVDVAQAHVVLSRVQIPYRPPTPPVSEAPPLPAVVEVWIDLTLPPTASLPRADHDGRAALHRCIVAQQDEVMAQLAQLGAVETARVQHARNALAVRIPATALDQARAIPGVRAVRVVRHLQRSMPQGR
jgi:hypothetical protein